MKNTIYMVDADWPQSRTYARQFERMFEGTEFIIRAIHPPYKKTADYLPLLSNAACFIIEQRLKDTGFATYMGLELADFLHSHESELPIYILTNYVDPLVEAVGSHGIAEVIAKGSLYEEGGFLRDRIMEKIDCDCLGCSEFLTD